jgi:hypothetical protein
MATKPSGNSKKIGNNPAVSLCNRFPEEKDRTIVISPKPSLETSV